VKKSGVRCLTNTLFNVCKKLWVPNTRRSHFSCPVIENVIWIEPLLRGHLSYKATFCLSQMWPFNTGLTVLATRLQILDSSLVFGTHNFLQTLKSVLVGHLTLFHWESYKFYPARISDKMWPYRTGDLLKEVQFIWHFLWQDKKKVTFKYRWLFNRAT
jgi:hypothetical protein